MLVTIKEIMGRAQQDDKVEFKGKVKKVFEFKAKKTKWTVGTQGIIVQDDTDEIKVIVNIKNEQVTYDNSIEGKEVEVHGKVSIYNNNKNIFGKLILDEPEPINRKSSEMPQASGKEKIKLSCLQRAIEFAQKFSPSEYTTDEIIDVAKKFERYVTGEILKPKIELPKDEVSQVEEEKLTEKEKLIKSIEEIAEDKKELAWNLIENVLKNKGKKNIEDLNMTELRALENSVAGVHSEEVPF